MISKEWETGPKPTLTLFSCLQFNILPIYIQLPWPWKASFTLCFRISAYRLNGKNEQRNTMTLSPSCYAIKWKRRFGFCFI